MIEILINLVQLSVAAFCTVKGISRAVSTRNRAWIVQSMFFCTFFLGDLYWLLYLVLYHRTPGLYSYISDISWYAAYLFLLLVMQELRIPGKSGSRLRILWGVPVFTGGMCLFFMTYGDLFGNLVTALLMGLLLWNTLRNLILLKDARAEERKKRNFYYTVLLFCVTEYTEWTVSCFWIGDTWKNPYFWLEILLAGCFVLLFVSLDKAVGR